MNFNVVYDAGMIERFHTCRTTRRQTVGEHSWGVAMVLMHICDPSVNLLKAAMLHDVPELVTGDIPAPAKWACRPLAEALNQFEDDICIGWGIAVELTDDEHNLLKWADMFELCLYAKAEVGMGNKYMTGPLVKGMRYLVDLPAPTERAFDLLTDFQLNVYGGSSNV